MIERREKEKINTVRKSHKSPSFERNSLEDGLRFIEKIKDILKLWRMNPMRYLLQFY